MFVDRVVLDFIAGKGGNGVVAWRREKYIPKGGPCGGNGGKGGSVILQADVEEHSLEWFRNRKKVQAENGVQGASASCRGRDGKDLIIKVPCGTLVKDSITQEVLKDLTVDGERWVVCQGGRGGRGNESFKSPTHQAPNFCTPGKPGEARRIELELKLIADVGLIGFPNAGKSTLITALADVQVKIAPYPFTTLHPNIGFIQCEDYTRIFLADIPGIIEGAHLNRGLGFEFLRHIERTSLLIYVLDASGIDGRHPWDDFQVLRAELDAYKEALTGKPFLVALNKIDTEEAALFVQDFKEKYPFDPQTLYEVSALRGDGVDKLERAIEDLVKNQRLV